MNTQDFNSLASRSRTFHGHRYVMPVAAWMLENGIRVAGVSEAIAGLGGRVDRPRIIEALVRLAEINALVELPRDAQPNSARMFERVESPYWSLLAAEARIGNRTSSNRTAESHVV